MNDINELLHKCLTTGTQKHAGYMHVSAFF